MITRADLIEARARRLVRAVDRNHRTKRPPLKYTVPWREVVLLMKALARPKEQTT